METYQIKDLSFTYPNCDKPALSHINLSIESGAFVTICGLSGSGKTTFLRMLKPNTSPHGVQSGEICFDGSPLPSLSDRRAACDIGFVMQSPENQIVTDKVWHELAFGLESIGLPSSEIRLRVAEMASFFGIQEWFHKSTTELSGGQKQILVLASIMVLQPKVLILDEPSSQLDPIAASEFLAIIGKINRELGTTIILTEHRLEEALPLSTRVLVMDNASICADGTAEEIGQILKAKAHKMFLSMPAPMRVWAASNADTNSQPPITICEGIHWLNKQTIKENHPTFKDITSSNEELAVQLNSLWFRYEKSADDILKDLNFTAHFGEFTAILGGNGTGKTTMLSLIAKLFTPHRGKVFAAQKVYLLPQNPETLFVCKTVREDLLEIFLGQSLSKAEKNEAVSHISKICLLDDLLDKHPYDLSGGEKQRAALAKVLLLKPSILLLDEPTKGLDAAFKQTFAGILKSLTASGVCIIMVSHDIEFCAEHADCCALFFDGNIVTSDTTRKFFSGNRFYSTSVNRMARHLLPDVITVDELITALGNKKPTTPTISHKHADVTPPDITEIVPPAPSFKSETIAQSSIKTNTRLSKRTLSALFLIFLSIPLTIFIGIYVLEDRQFYFISLLIILQTMLPFALIFESRKPQARELIIIAVLCAIAVAGRTAFLALPQLKPVIAIVIISGIAFGGEAGFFVGSTSAFVSNMFFGQGPWTPWQMFALGIIGFLAGVLSHKGLLTRKPILLAIFGGFSALFIYGGILNPASVLMFQPDPTFEMFLLWYLYGLPFDLVHAIATAMFLLIIAKPMLEKLDRIKLKYGLVE